MFLGLLADRFEVAAGRHIVRFQNLVVTVLIMGVAQHNRANIGVVAVETRGAAADPARTFDDLRTKVEQQALIVAMSKSAQIEPPNDGHDGKTAFKFEPRAHQAP